ncbi:MAG: hypothetical protein NT027_18740 [Proteobacteria bacterium]|nr:hypothetical protein [Pseudomonadota bacterium]
MSRGLGRRRVVLAGALISGDLPLTSRLETLSKFITPAPNSEIEVDNKIADKYGPKDKNHGMIYGEIEVNPPKGHCFTVTRSIDKTDDVVCKKTKLKWFLRDLDMQSGDLEWRVSTGQGDFGTPIRWKTSYRIAKIISSKFEFNDESSDPMFMRSCVAIPADKPNFIGRRIQLKFFNGESWTIRFPDKDTPIPPWEPPKPTPPPEEKKNPKKDEHGGTSSADEHGKTEKEKGEHSKGKDSDKKDAEAETQKAKLPQMEAWTLSTRRGFVMNSDLVLSGRMPPSSKKGECRYQYDGVIGDFNTGRLECHYGDGFTYFYTVLPCMKFLQRD